MTVEINLTRKAVEISWDPEGAVPEPPEEEKPPGYPAHPIILPGEPTHPIVLPPEGEKPPEGEGPHPEHPIFLPPYIWGPTDPRPGTGLPGDQPEVGEPDFPTPPIELPDPPPDLIEGVPPEKLEAIKDFLLGNLPPYEGGPSYPVPVMEGEKYAAVQVFAQGQEGDWHNTAVLYNDGFTVLTYPVDFVGESYVEVRALDGTLVDTGTISVE